MTAEWAAIDNDPRISTSSTASYLDAESGSDQ